MPWFGDNSGGTAGTPTSDGRALASRYVLTEDGSLTSMFVNFSAGSTAGTNFKGLIFADAAGVPGALLVTSSAAAIPAGGGWVEAAIAGDLPAGTYWLGYVCDFFTAFSLSDETPSVVNAVMANGTVNYAAPGAWPGTDASYEIRLNAYVEYDVAGAGIAAELAVTLEAASLAATAVAPVTGSLGTTLANASLAATGVSVVAGSLASSLADAALVATGTLAVRGVVAVALEDAALAATGTATTPAISAELAVTLADAVLHATSVPASEAVLAVVLADAVLTATAGTFTVEDLTPTVVLRPGTTTGPVARPTDGVTTVPRLGSGAFHVERPS